MALGGRLRRATLVRMTPGDTAGPTALGGSQATRGMWFEDFELGMAFESPGRTITESDIQQFAGLSGDYTSLHTDQEHARRTPFRRVIAHGLLIQSIVTGLATRTGV